MIQPMALNKVVEGATIARKIHGYITGLDPSSKRRLPSMSKVGQNNYSETKRSTKSILRVL